MRTPTQQQPPPPNAAAHREEVESIRVYLESLKPEWEAEATAKARTATEARLVEVEEWLAKEPDTMDALMLTAERHRLKAILNRPVTVDRTDMEREFVRRAAGFGRQHGIGYPAWRDMGVPAAVLKAAGIDRAGGTIGQRKTSSGPSAGTGHKPENPNKGVTTPEVAAQYETILSTIHEHGPFNHPQGWAVRELIEATGIPEKRMSTRLRELDAAGRITRVIRGKRTMRVALPDQAHEQDGTNP